MKPIAIALYLFAANAWAANWEVVAMGLSPYVTVDIDASSVTEQGKYRKAWSRWIYGGPQHFPESTIEYRSAKRLEYYSCSEKSSGVASMTVFPDKDSHGKPQIVFSEKLQDVNFRNVEPDSVGEQIFKYVCNYRIGQKKQK